MSKAQDVFMKSLEKNSLEKINYEEGRSLDEGTLQSLQESRENAEGVIEKGSNDRPEKIVPAQSENTPRDALLVKARAFREERERMRLSKEQYNQSTDSSSKLSGGALSDTPSGPLKKQPLQNVADRIQRSEGSKGSSSKSIEVPAYLRERYVRDTTKDT